MMLHWAVSTRGHERHNTYDRKYCYDSAVYDISSKYMSHKLN